MTQEALECHCDTVSKNEYRHLVRFLRLLLGPLTEPLGVAGQDTRLAGHLCPGGCQLRRKLSHAELQALADGGALPLAACNAVDGADGHTERHGDLSM